MKLDFVEGFRYLRDGGRGKPTTANLTGQHQDSDSKSRPSTSRRGSKYATDLKERTGISICEITGLTTVAGEPLFLHGCHLIPYSTNDNPRQRFFWSLLRCFWPDSVVNDLEMFAKEHLHHALSNGIAMQAGIHYYFDNLWFYLEPIFDSTMTDVSYSAYWRWRGPACRIYNYWLPPIVLPDGDETFRTFKDGQLVTFTTKDPTKYPLPDPTLLYIRSVLAKVAYPSAGGAILSWDDDDDDQYTMQSCSSISSSRTSKSGGLSPNYDTFIPAQLAPASDYDDIIVRTSDAYLQKSNDIVRWLHNS
ncbi:hypothetical protein K440DRAFT_197318 [Wilcoxina mikolae CBS 423.85]|nr:hypothetical protein K440DRAFT_197318 [Wilcoxina mikolae CBS 423.85]